MVENAPAATLVALRKVKEFGFTRPAFSGTGTCVGGMSKSGADEAKVAKLLEFDSQF